jgi:hypothetical protein
MPVVVESAIDRKVREFYESNLDLQQFGQPDDDEVWGGKTACTHTCWQGIILLWTGKKLSLNRINQLAGMPKNAKAANGRPRGMRIAESLKLIKALGLPYAYKKDLSWVQLQKAGQKGPVLYGMRYGSAPDWKGKAGADGVPNGYARKNGRTQFAGAENIRHAVVMCCARKVKNTKGSTLRIEVLRKDPNHGSPRRKERPPYDIISPMQASREYHDILKVGGTLFAFVPTKSLPV